MSEPVTSSAICCWCRQSLVQVDGIWWCPTDACRTRQRSHALGRQVGLGRGKGTKWQWLYVPTPKQVEFDACPAKYVLYGGAAGPGKSHAARWALYRRCLRQSGYEALILRETFPELEKTHLRRMAGEAELIGARFIESKRLMEFPNKSLIECGHMDDAAAVKKYLSTEYHCIVPDEGSQFDPRPLLELSTRARRISPDGTEKGKFWVVSNPGGPSSSMLLDFFIDHMPDWDQYPSKLREKYDPEQWVYIPGTLDDNPYLDPDYESSLALLAPWRYDQLRHGDWRVFAGQFFGTFNERRHVRDLGPLGDDVRWFRAMDWGYNKPGCWGFYAILPDGRLYKRSDRKFAGESVQTNAAKLREKSEELGIKRFTYNVADPSTFIKTGNVGQKEAKFIGQSIAATFGMNGVTLTRGENDRYNGWQRLHDLLRDAPDGDPWIIFHPSCKYTIRTMATAKSDDKDPDDVDTDSDDHALDETRYAAMSRPHPLGKAKTRRHYPAGTMGALRHETASQSLRLGTESTRAAVA
ncbi:MAG: phage terminase large subunit [Gemmatimonadaceae bacterium]|nr:phage terminase large subunit [Gemmatimonadaceae bacterium]